MTSRLSAWCGIARNTEGAHGAAGTGRTGGAGGVAEATGVTVVATAPGRVNLIGEHTDYAGGLALPMAVDLATAVEGRRLGDRIVLDSDAAEGVVNLRAHPGDDPEQHPGAASQAAAHSGRRGDAVTAPHDADGPLPPWGAHVEAVRAGLAARGQGGGLEGTVRTTLPVGAGLSSSAALDVALALALGFVGTRGDLAALARDAEERAVGVPCGMLDQVTSVAAVAGHALLIDFAHLAVRNVVLPEGLEVVVVHSGQQRTLAGSAYAERRGQCEAAASELGPLGAVTPDDVTRLADPVLRRRARHVVSENARVLAMVEAFERSDLVAAGQLLDASHRSLRDDFEVSTTVLDALVDRLASTPGVYGARLTGGGFGGCVVAFTEPGALSAPPKARVDPLDGADRWSVRASDGASVSLVADPRDQS